ncbi:MAG TPA: SprB repeat-containing protein, partial [Bacteroidales bacterium]|nr:SprB repeat-containing protein [Bacteroidales bacterium]
LKAENISITEPLELQAYITNFKHVTCNNGGDGEATLGIEGGTQPYIINWITGQKTQHVQGLFAGNYIANITDNNGCFTSTSVYINQPNLLQLKLQLPMLHVTELLPVVLLLVLKGEHNHIQFLWKQLPALHFPILNYCRFLREIIHL